MRVPTSRTSVSNPVTRSLLCGSISIVAGRNGNPVGRAANGVAEHFGRQMRKEREARGWTLTELGERTGINAAHLGRVEAGRRPPTEQLALACDHVFPERDGWFSEWYRDSRSWMPPGFRSWTEYEDRAAHLSVWCPGVVHGLAQAEGYARELLAVEPGATEDQIKIRLTARMERQRRVLYRDDPPSVRFVIDHAALYRLVGSPAVMCEQLQHLLDLAAMPRVTVQLLPQVAHAATSAELILADDAAYTEHLAAGAVYTEGGAFTRLETIFHTIQAESYRASETLALVREAIDRWNVK